MSHASSKVTKSKRKPAKPATIAYYNLTKITQVAQTDFPTEFASVIDVDDIPWHTEKQDMTGFCDKTIFLGYIAWDDGTVAKLSASYRLRSSAFISCQNTLLRLITALHNVHGINSTSTVLNQGYSTVPQGQYNDISRTKRLSIISTMKYHFLNTSVRELEDDTKKNRRTLHPDCTTPTTLPRTLDFESTTAKDYAP
ncbi:hypothetical protein EK21DRAFT_114596 [Setomelanomma holmii]|uniref:Uncharacterized protein n=1 Tax=Setomelanomma holmii TaxID=210430 RepID=A0A9P4LJZ0_9PLEO|nr:hypothetical protein EK21DRAFT_114596 [Setomelanomma holmii]